MYVLKHFIVVLLLTTFITTAPADVYAGKQTPRQVNSSVSVQLEYLLYLPPEYEAKDKWPVLLFLHGAGERGDNLEAVKIHGPPQMISQGREFPFIVVSPLCPKGRWWRPHELIALLDDIAAQHKVDEDRVYCTGLSMGGFGTWATAFYDPHRFAALVPICGGGEQSWARHLKHVPTWAFHGAKDAGVPVHRSEDMAKAMQKANGNMQLTIYPEGKHNVWTETYNKPELFEWLLKQRRVQP